MTAPTRSLYVGMLREHEPMSRHTTWGVGGPADLYFKPDNLDELCRFLAELPADQPVSWLGLGSNVLVRDGGIRGIVIATHGALDQIEYTDGGAVRVEAGVPCAKVAKFCARQGLGPAEFFAGIPGTMGGALAMNAGAFGGETWDAVTAVEVINRQGRVRLREASEYKIGYRQVSGPVDEWFVAARLELATAQPTRVEGIRKILAQRKSTQPTGEPSCGSVFRNPRGDYAARLIEAAGLKGYRIGGARISQKHANFIVNDGTATAADVEALINHVETSVQCSAGVRLEREVRILGTADD